MPKQHLSDLDELLEQVQSEQSKQYFTEAILSYRIGAYRAAIIATWISICVDVIDKIDSMAHAGDANAIKIQKEIREIAPDDKRAMQDMEGSLLDKACKDFELISEIEKRHLVRVREDRHYCAHPTFQPDGKQFQPTPELVRQHIVHAGNYLLIQLPTQGKSQIDKWYDLIIGDTFPGEQEKAFQVLCSDYYLGKAKSTAVRNLLINILKRLFIDKEKLAFKTRAQLISSALAIQRISNEIYNQVVSEKLNTMLAQSDEKCFKRILRFLNQSPELHGKIDPANKERIISLIRGMDAEDIVKFKIPHLIGVAISLAQFNQLFPVGQSEREQIIRGCPASVFIEEAINIFTESGSFNSAYSNGNDHLLPHARFLDESTLGRVFEGALNNTKYYGINQILRAGGMDSIFIQLYDYTKKWRSPWKNFWSNLSEKGEEDNFEELKTALQADDVIPKDFTSPPPAPTA